MVSIQLDAARAQRLAKLAKERGEAPERLAQSIIEEFLDFEALAGDSDGAWAEASLALAPEVVDDAHWTGDEANGS